MTDETTPERTVVDLEARGYTFGGTSTCTGPTCGRIVYWWLTAAGKRSPHDADGISHFATCPDRERFRRQKERKA